jgi:predicted SnoaL-like aldol condensation-catalyzing enzyme
VTGAVGAAQRALLQSQDTRLARNKRLVFDLWREVVEAGKAQRASQYIGAGYIEHDPNAASGLQGFTQHFSARAERPVEPWIRAPVVAIVAEGDLVALVTMREHPHPVHAGRKYTTTWFDLFRIADGRVVEHWNSAAPGDPATEAGW